eukprot:2235714-Pleurochrysis_carterae.AAC.6
MLNFRGRAIDAELPRSRESLIFRAHGGTVIQRAICRRPHNVVVSSGNSWPCCYYNNFSFAHTTLTLRATVVAASASCNKKRRGSAADSGSVRAGYQGLPRPRYRLRTLSLIIISGYSPAPTINFIGYSWLRIRPLCYYYKLYASMPNTSPDKVVELFPYRNAYFFIPYNAYLG